MVKPQVEADPDCPAPPPDLKKINQESIITFIQNKKYLQIIIIPMHIFQFL